MIRLDCAAATRASTERGGTGSGPAGPHRARAARYLLLDLIADERIGFARFREWNGAASRGRLISEVPGTARSISSCEWASIETALSAAYPKDAATSE